MDLTCRDLPSPNHDERGAAIDMVVLHYTGMETADAARERLCDAGAKVSAHYLIDEDGTLEQLVDEDRRAWHAGVASWHGASDINARSIGIELVNPGHEFGYRFFPEAQIAVLEALLKQIVGRYGIAPDRVVGHADVAPARKSDPGELFPWGRLAEQGLATMLPPHGLTGSRAPSTRAVKALGQLTRIGYDIADPDAAILAFQRHFRPGFLTGLMDTGTVNAADWLVLQLDKRPD